MLSADETKSSVSQKARIFYRTYKIITFNAELFCNYVMVYTIMRKTADSFLKEGKPQVVISKINNKNNGCLQTLLDRSVEGKKCGRKRKRSPMTFWSTLCFANRFYGDADYLVQQNFVTCLHCQIYHYLLLWP